MSEWLDTYANITEFWFLILFSTFIDQYGICIL